MLKFGIIGPGNIAKKFADACKLTENAELVAVASTNLDRAAAFAKEYGVKKAYGSYEELLEEEEIQAVYISVINTKHLEVIRQCVVAKKAVLCEKPCVLSEKDALELIQLQKDFGVLIMEGMWTNFLPLTNQVKNWLTEQKIGKVRFMECSFSFYSERNPDGRLYAPVLGGGALYDVGVYCLAYAIRMLGKPVSQDSCLQMGPTGVDEFGVTRLKFADESIAECRYGVRLPMENDARIYGENGLIYVKSFWNGVHCERYNQKHELVEKHTFEDINGFTYEIDHFAALYEAKKTESEINTLEQTRLFARLYDIILRGEKKLL